MVMRPLGSAGNGCASQCGKEQARKVTLCLPYSQTFARGLAIFVKTSTSQDLRVWQCTCWGGLEMNLALSSIQSQSFSQPFAKAEGLFFEVCEA